MWLAPRNFPLPGEALKYVPRDFVTRPLALWLKPRRNGDATLSLPDEALTYEPQDFATRPLAPPLTPRNVPLPGEALKRTPQDFATRSLASWLTPRRKGGAALSRVAA